MGLIIVGSSNDVDEMKKALEECGEDVCGCDVWDGPVPDGSFVQLEQNVRMSTAEYFFLRKSNELPFLKALELGIELCGKYRTKLTCYTMEDGRNYDFLMEPRTKRAHIRKYLEQIAETKEGIRALEVLKYVIDGSCSPMSTYLYMILRTPKKYGGAGLPKPDISAAYVMDETFYPSAKGAFIAYDVCWPDKRLAIQYVEGATRKDVQGLLIGGMDVFTFHDKTLHNRDRMRLRVEDISEMLTGSAATVDKQFFKDVKIPNYDHMKLTVEDIESHRMAD